MQAGAKKSKLNATQLSRQQFLQKLLDNKESSEFALMVASSYIELDLFGTYSQQ